MVDLQRLNTLKVQAKATDLIEVNTLKDLKKLNPETKYLTIGSGANILFTQDFAGTVLKMSLRGKKIVAETNTDILIKLGAGENWHDFVMWSVNNGWSGAENMALIPSTVGAAVVGNIAAYGGNQEDIFESVSVLDLKTNTSQTFSKSDRLFSYRDSIFKQHPDWLVTSVVYRLSKSPHPQINYHDRYTSLETELSKIALPPYTTKHIAQAVINLRLAKLPNIDEVGSAGSFFKNPIVDLNTLKKLKGMIKELQFYPEDKLSYEITNWEIPNDLPVTSKFKIPAARLLDELGWRGKKIGNVSTSPNQALYVINLGGATGSEILAYAESMKKDVLDNFQVDLEFEIKVV